MKKKITLTAALLVCAGCIWAGLPDQIVFMDKTYYFSETNESGLSFFKTQDDNINSGFTIISEPLADPRKKAQEMYRKCNFGDECFLESCSSDDFLLQYRRKSNQTEWIYLLRFTKQGALGVWFSGDKNLFLPLPAYWDALCQFPLDILQQNAAQ